MWNEKYFNNQIGYTSTWFRGQGTDEEVLLPGLLRMVNNDDFKKTDFGVNILNIENDILSHFLEHTSSFIPKGNDLVNTYFLAQHHGLPTRLLDWTTSPICALFFAVENRSNDEKNGVIYFMNPNDLECGIVQFQNSPRIYNHLNNILSNIDNYIFEKKASIESKLIGFWPPWSSNRLYAQSARFIFFEPIDNRKEDNQNERAESLIIDDSYLRKHQNFIKKYIIPAEKKESIRKELYILGITRRLFFPDLDNIARDIREHYYYRKPDHDFP